MQDLEINCPADPQSIRNVIFNGADIGGVDGVTRLIFEMLPGQVPCLTMERESLKGGISSPRVVKATLE